METLNLTKFSYQLLDINNPVFKVFMFWNSILAIKFLCMSFLTSFHRLTSGTAANPEDVAISGATEVTVNDHVERVRRAHRNDMENILPYLSIGLFYVMTDPSPMVAIILIRVAVVIRFVHTFVYAIYVIPQPARAICFLIHNFITQYMAIMCVIHFL